MTDKEIATQHCPLCVNIHRLATYLLADDEVILFDWLTIKQSMVFDYKEFYYSLERIAKETRLKRRRIERVIKRFCAMGILLTKTLPKADSPGRVRYFIMNFGAVVERLPEIIDQSSKNVADFRKYFKALARLQERADKGKASTREIEDKEKAEELYQALNEVYWERIDMYNYGELTETKPTRIKTKTELPKDKITMKRLGILSARYELGTIRNSFIALCDDFLQGGRAMKNVGNLIKYYLSYKPETDSFGVMEKYLSKFQKYYSKVR